MKTPMILPTSLFFQKFKFPIAYITCIVLLVSSCHSQESTQTQNTHIPEEPKIETMPLRVFLNSIEIQNFPNNMPNGEMWDPLDNSSADLIVSILVSGQEVYRSEVFTNATNSSGYNVTPPTPIEINPMAEVKIVLSDQEFWKEADFIGTYGCSNLWNDHLMGQNYPNSTTIKSVDFQARCMWTYQMP